MSKINQDLSGRRVCIMATDGFEQSELMVEALQNAGKFYEFLELEEAGHSYRADGERQKELETILAFVQKYLPVSQMEAP